MAWLVREGRVLASLDVAASHRSRLRGLLGRDPGDGALLLHPTRSVHTLGMRVPLDVAFLADDGDGSYRVLRTMRLAPNRVTFPVWRADAALEAASGAFRSWGLAVGDVLDVTP